MRIALPLVLAGAVAVAAATAHAEGAGRGIPTGFRPETAAAVGTRNYWVIGEYKCPVACGASHSFAPRIPAGISCA